MTNEITGAEWPLVLEGVKMAVTGEQNDDVSDLNPSPRWRHDGERLRSSP